MSRIEHAFSVVMDSKEHVRSLALNENARDCVMFEGVLGELEEIRMVDGVMIEIRGAHGVLRIDLTESELRRALTKKIDQDDIRRT
jgi:hypothetical protein